MRKVITGEQVAQIYNRDPYALPVWRAPVYQTPAGITLLVQLFRLLGWLVRLIAQHPAAATVLAVLALIWLSLGWPGLIALVACAVVLLVTWRWFWPVSFARWISGPARGRWRAWFYRRRWVGVMAISGAAPWHQGRVVLPVLGRVTATRYTDRVQVRLVSGQSLADVAKHAEALAHGFGALLYRVRSARSGAVVLEFVRRDALAAIVPALPIPAAPDLKALPVGRREDGQPWRVRLHGTHVLVAGATGAGKASLLWGLVRAMFPLMQSGLVRVLAADPKLMELAYGRAVFDTYGAYAASPGAVAVMLDQAVAGRQDLPPVPVCHPELYRYLLRRHLSPTFDTRPLAEIREPHVRRWRKDLLDTGVSAVTIAKAYRLLKAILNTAGANLRELMERMGHSTTRAATVYLHGGTERQQAIADELSRQPAEQLGRSKKKPSGTQRARRRRTAS